MRSAPDWIVASVRTARDAAIDVREITLVPERGWRRATPGSHIDVQLDIAGITRTRSYSVVEDTNGAWTVAVRRLPDGRGGSLAMCTLQQGDTLKITAPDNHFELGPAAPETLLIAGGIGITPLLGMARSLASRANVHMAYAGRSRAHLPFLDSLTTLLQDRLQVFASDEGQHLALRRTFKALHPEGEAYLCGPPAMLSEARRHWREAGRSPALLRFETFGSGGSEDPERFRVHVRDHARTIDVPRDSSLLDALAQAGINVAYDCLRGECGLCAIDVIAQATLDHRDVFLSESQRAEGRTICACVSRASGELTVDTGYRPSLVRTPAGSPSP